MNERPVSRNDKGGLNVWVWVTSTSTANLCLAVMMVLRPSCPIQGQGLDTDARARVVCWMARRWVTGWKLDTADRERLLEHFRPLFPDVVADHVTLRTGTNASTPLPRATCGQVVGEIDDGAGVQALVVRIGGATDRSDGSTYHITWSLDRSRGRRPVESNVVIARLGWRSLAEPISVRLRPARF